MPIEAMLMGILHGDIRRENILVSSSGVTIIDFRHSERYDDQETMDKEYARLRCFLGFE
jgi:tRNA A-37 threonylcarbamoyl transferase component Bud32